MKLLGKVLKSVFIGLYRFVLVLLVFLASLYFRTNIYKFPENKPFAGEQFYNPYEGYRGNLMKANFHAHSALPLKLTHGENQPAEVIEHYMDNGYDFAGLSNYFWVHSRKGEKFDIGIYEHGWNIMKTHQLSMNVDESNMFDIPFKQNIHQKQSIINKLRNDGAYVTLAHPKFNLGYSLDDMKKLKHFHFIEVLNHYRTSDEHWDTLLTTGNLAWLTAGDDTHDIDDGYAFVRWNMIDVAEVTKEEMFVNMLKGNHFGVMGRNAENFNLLKKVSVFGDSLVRYDFIQEAEHIILIGNNGNMLRETYCSKFIDYKIKPTDTYIRAEIVTGNNVMFLNPIVRYNGKELPYVKDMSPEVNFPLTILYKTAFGIVILLLIYLLLFVRFKNGLSLVWFGKK